MSDNKDVDLARIRERIDSLDEKIEALISERAHIAKQVGATKERGRSTADYYRPEREAQVLRGVIERNQGPLADEEIVRLFREIMSACLAQQEPLKVAYLGPEGTLTQTAVTKHFGHSVNAISMPSVDEVFREVESEVADFGIVPLETFHDGVITHTLDMFISSPLHICGEVELLVEQHLLSRGASLDGIKTVYANQQSLVQCRDWLKGMMKGVKLEQVASSTSAARRARDDAASGAIAGYAASRVYHLNVLAKNVEDRPDNRTRFLVIGRDLFAPSGCDKTSMLMSSSHKPGALQQLLKTLGTHEINMTRIESRPSNRGQSDYVFFVDVEGHANDDNIADALTQLEKSAATMRVIGSYPRAIL
ncbi:MAG: prephenate dehydratase [Gammaproteobacteria bacterium]|nr:prephenate dehydratase [Gammaproteobacteria bacterium]